MEYVEEFEESTQLKAHTVATYSFFKNFSVDKEAATLSWNRNETFLNPEQTENFRNLLKYFTKKLKNQELNPSQCGRAMLFWFSKVQELGLFTPAIRAEIRAWMEICELIVA
jgi:hypothetical protein